MAFKASFKFSDSREFDVLTWRVKFNRDVDPKGRPASDIYGGTIYVEVESTPDTIVLDKMFKQYQPVNGNIVFKKADEDAKMKELVTLSKILCKWKQDSVVSLFLYLNSVFKHKHKLIHNQAPV